MRKEGESYRNFLKTRVKELGIEKNVRFVNKYLSLHELIERLKTFDFYITPYLDPELFLRKPVRLRVTESSCTFTFPNISSLFYSANGEPPYISLGHATNFLGPKQHRFRFGSSLEFSLDIP